MYITHMLCTKRVMEPCHYEWFFPISGWRGNPPVVCHAPCNPVNYRCNVFRVVTSLMLVLLWVCTMRMWADMSTFRSYMQSSGPFRQNISPKHHERCKHPHGTKTKEQSLWRYLLVDEPLLSNLKTLEFAPYCVYVLHTFLSCCLFADVCRVDVSYGAVR
jgi:hypothetical protein